MSDADDLNDAPTAPIDAHASRVDSEGLKLSKLDRSRHTSSILLAPRETRKVLHVGRKQELTGFSISRWIAELLPSVYLALCGKSVCLGPEVCSGYRCRSGCRSKTPWNLAPGRFLSQEPRRRLQSCFFRGGMIVSLMVLDTSKIMSRMFWEPCKLCPSPRGWCVGVVNRNASATHPNRRRRKWKEQQRERREGGSTTRNMGILRQRGE